MKYWKLSKRKPNTGQPSIRSRLALPTQQVGENLKETSHLPKYVQESECADNAAMENFFGILKQEMYYGEELVSYEELKRKLEAYMDYYNHERIKAELAGLSPIQYRTQTCQSAS
ncbi:Integrase core domain-containing protein [Halobacillus dabanensis]|uniref:Integrase core domain-containing protein n=1 Tax=Halobacillus dabanensis TaxID=240302 RepID=A0A1I3UIS3_HALDA|nr:IS3 family transposase [Halobacillus dabanensis]SFJ82613.1 Integrase core domain-containing protein [Halobacillus dabanensis]